MRNRDRALTQMQRTFGPLLSLASSPNTIHTTPGLRPTPAHERRGEAILPSFPRRGGTRTLTLPSPASGRGTFPVFVTGGLGLYARLNRELNCSPFPATPHPS